MEEQVQIQKDGKAEEKKIEAVATPKPVAIPAAKVEKKEEKKTPTALSSAKDKVKAKTEEKAEEKKVEIVLERKYIIPLYDAYAKPAKKRAAKAIKIIRAFAARHMKVDLTKVKIDNRLAHFVNARGSKHPPKKLNVKLQKTKEGVVTALTA